MKRFCIDESVKLYKEGKCNLLSCAENNFLNIRIDAKELIKEENLHIKMCAFMPEEVVNCLTDYELIILWHFHYSKLPTP